MKKIKYTFLIITTMLSLSISANSGKDIFDRYCTVCHAPSMASMFGSPAAHDLQAWDERKINILNKASEQNSLLQTLSIEEKNKEAIKLLVESASNGTENGMPPMGTCMDCTSNDLQAAIEFMSTIEN